MMETARRVYLIDGSAYIFRAFFALPRLTNAAGLPTHAIYGFTTMTLKFLRSHKPQYLAVALDAGRETFRNEIYQDYKGNRPAAPADLVPQFPYIRKMLEALNVPVLELEGFEADDIIATLVHKFSALGLEVVVVSSDKDLMQLVGENVRLLDTAKEKWIDVEGVRQKFGVEPGKVTEVMGLMGDAIDNIPGVKGIGEKTAAALIQRYGSLENLFDRLDELENSRIKGAGRIRKALADNKDMAFMSRELAKVKTDVPVAVEPEALRYSGPLKDRLRELFEELGFQQLLRALETENLATH
jgi:DNA polymerase I